MGNYDFLKDLSASFKSARVVESFLKNEGWDFRQCHNAKYDYLIWKGGRQHRIELKEQFKTAETGNCVLEFECRGKPSGIAVTNADLWFEIIPEPSTGVKSLYCATVKKLMEKIEWYDYQEIKVGGDLGSETKMYLWPFLKYVTYFKKIL